MVKLRTNIVAKLNHSGDNGMIAAHRSDILRLIYERKDRFGVRVRQCDINDILTALNLKQSEVQTVESKYLINIEFHVLVFMNFRRN